MKRLNFPSAYTKINNMLENQIVFVLIKNSGEIPEEIRNEIYKMVDRPVSMEIDEEIQEAVDEQIRNIYFKQEEYKNI